MSNTNVNLTDDFMDEVALIVNDLMLEEFDNDPNATLDGYIPSEEHQKAIEKIFATPKKRASRTVKRVFIVAAVLRLLCA